jgi:hypothetical protein
MIDIICWATRAHIPLHDLCSRKRCKVGYNFDSVRMGKGAGSSFGLTPMQCVTRLLLITTWTVVATPLPQNPMYFYRVQINRDRSIHKTWILVFNSIKRESRHKWAPGCSRIRRRWVCSIALILGHAMFWMLRTLEFLYLIVRIILASAIQHAVFVIMACCMTSTWEWTHYFCVQSVLSSDFHMFDHIGHALDMQLSHTPLKWASRMYSIFYIIRMIYQVQQ